MLVNLASNAIKYNRPNGSVVISAEEGQAPGTVRLVVSDTGIGIPAERQGELFQPFNRLGAERSAIEGSGMGAQYLPPAGWANERNYWIRQQAGIWQSLLGGAAAIVRGGAARSVFDPAGELSSEARPATILYVEDNPASLVLMTQLVAAMPNCRMLPAPSGELGFPWRSPTAPS